MEIDRLNGLYLLIESSRIRGSRIIQAVWEPIMKTYHASSDTVRRQWFVVDAANMVLGRLATQIAHILRGKHKPEFTPHADTGDYIVVINVEKIRVTGNKGSDKEYHTHTGTAGGLKTTTFDKLQAKNPGRILELAVKGMLPKNPLGRQMFRKLKVYTGNEHPHSAQQPEAFTINE